MQLDDVVDATHTGKSLSEALLFAEHGENMLCTKIVRKQFLYSQVPIKRVGPNKRVGWLF